MGLTNQDREAIREEEMARSIVREELKRQRRPRLYVIATIWTLALIALAALFTHSPM